MHTNNRGITLVELLVVITIMAVILALSSMVYSTWTKRYKLEGQVRQMYSDLMNARAQAMQNNRVRIVVISPGSYSVWEDTDNSGDKSAGDTSVILDKELKFPAQATYNIIMDAKGLVSSDAANGEILFTIGDIKAEYDCIALVSTRIRMGTYDGNETTCKLR